jgi:hypothetical protein
MTRPPLRRKIAALFLATAFIASWASAAEPSDHGTRGLLALTEDLLDQLWSVWPRWFPVQLPEAQDEGCHADPSGRCVTGSGSLVPPDALDAGCHADPSGRCITGSSSLVPLEALDEGCHADPDGHCASGS